MRTECGQEGYSGRQRQNSMQVPNMPSLERTAADVEMLKKTNKKNPTSLKKVQKEDYCAHDKKNTLTQIKFPANGKVMQNTMSANQENSCK